MVKKALAISTLAVLAAGDLTHQAIASPDVTTSTPKPAASNHVVPTEASPASQSKAAIAPPEVVVKPEFSQSTRSPVSAIASNSSAKSTQTSTKSANTKNVVVPATQASLQTAKTPVSPTNQSSSTSAPASQTAKTPVNSTNQSSSTSAPALLIAKTSANSTIQSSSTSAQALQTAKTPANSTNQSSATSAQALQIAKTSTNSTNQSLSTSAQALQIAKTPANSTNQSSATSAQSTNANALAVSTKTPAKPNLPNDLAVTATDVQVKGVTDEMQQLVLKTIRTRPGGSTNQSQLDNDIATTLNTGFFSDAHVTHSVNKDGWNVVFQVEPVVVRSLQLTGNQVLTPAIANDAFKSQVGQPVSLTALRQGVEQLSKWYKDNGYQLAQVVSAQPNRDGVVTIDVAEGVIGNINIRFLDKDGKPTKGRTKEDFLNHELKLKSGQVFRVDVARQDLQHLYQLGLFDNANISLNGDSRKVDVTYDLTEHSARGVNAGGGYSTVSGLFGTISYKDQNFGGVNQQLGANLQVGTRDVQFSGDFTNPYRESNPDMPGYSIDVFRHRTLSQTFDDHFADSTEVSNYEQPREGQYGGGITLTKPVGEWNTSLGVNYTHTSIRDSDGKIIPVDSLGNPLSFSGTGVDDLVSVTAGVTRDQRDNPINPTNGSLFNVSTQQSIPVGNGNILMNRIQANYSQYLPVNLLGTKDPQVLAFNVQGGTTIGDLPPYMAYNLGGLDSVRGYGTGDVASGRSYVLASAEYRIPIYNPVGAVLFADFGSDLGTADSVLGEPGVVRGKPGTGFGYGAGLRVNSPVGIIRADLGFNDQGDSRLQFGLGQRF